MKESAQERTQEILYSGRFDAVTVAQARALIESEADLSIKPVTQNYYFGCYQRLGHYLFDQNMNRLRYGSEAQIQTPFPWQEIDGKLTPKGSGGAGREGAAALHHKDGWTALAFADYSVDSRPGSNSVFLFDSRLGFEDALDQASRVFPQIMNRLTFEITLAK